MRRLLIPLLTGCADEPATVHALDVGAAAVALADDGRTGTLGVADGARPAGDWARIQVAAGTACALEAGGRPDCWQVGADTTLSSVPAGPFDTFSVADGRAIFVFGDGTLMHWPQVEHALPTDGPWIGVAAVGASEVNHPGLCGVDADGALWCGVAAVPAPGGPWDAVSRTGGTLCALERAGGIRCFDVGADGWSEVAHLPGPHVALDTGAAGGVCGLDASGGITCAGVGQAAADWPALAPGGTGHTAIALSSEAAWGCALTDGAPACFGAAGAVPGGDWAW